jgi:hypothetical protein
VRPMVRRRMMQTEMADSESMSALYFAMQYVKFNTGLHDFLRSEGKNE